MLRNVEDGVSDRMSLERALARGAEQLLKEVGEGEFAWILGSADAAGRHRKCPRVATLAGLTRLAQAKGESTAIEAAREICRSRLSVKAAEAWLRNLRLGRVQVAPPRGLDQTVREAIAAWWVDHIDVDQADIVLALQTHLAAAAGPTGLARLLICQAQAFAKVFPQASNHDVVAAIERARDWAFRPPAVS